MYPYSEGDDGRLYRAPRNSVGEPSRPTARAVDWLVLARLVWPREVVVVPAIARHVAEDRIHVEWQTERGVRRRSWLPLGDVVMRWRGVGRSAGEFGVTLP